MQSTELMEDILFEALTDYSKKKKLVISKIENGCFSRQFERGSGLTVTLDDGRMLEIMIFEATD